MGREIFFSNFVPLFLFPFWMFSPNFAGAGSWGAIFFHFNSNFLNCGRVRHFPFFIEKIDLMCWDWLMDMILSYLFAFCKLTIPHFWWGLVILIPDLASLFSPGQHVSLTFVRLLLGLRVLEMWQKCSRFFCPAGPLGNSVILMALPGPPSMRFTQRKQKQRMKRVFEMKKQYPRNWSIFMIFLTILVMDKPSSKTWTDDSNNLTVPEQYKYIGDSLQFVHNLKKQVAKNLLYEPLVSTQWGPQHLSVSCK